MARAGRAFPTRGRIVPCMNRRVRLFAALLALLAFSASMAEQGVGWTCAPETAAAAGHGPGQIGANHGDAGAPDDAHEMGGGEHTPGAPPCCAPSATSATCAVAALPAAAAVLWRGPLVVRVAEAPPASRLDDLLLGASSFRPPQA